MAESASPLTDCKAQRVAVTVELDAQQLLRVAGGFALHPNRLARSRPIDPAPLVDGTDQRLSRAPDESQRLSQLLTDHGGPHTPPAVEWLGKRSRERLAQGQAVCVQRHAHLRIRPERIERLYIIGCGNSTCRRDACWPGRRDGVAHGLEVESAHRAFVLDLGEEKPTHIWGQRGDPFTDASASVRAPSVDHDVAMLRVNCRDHAVARQLAAQLRAGDSPQHYLARAGIEPGAGRLQRANPAADATGCAPYQRLDQRGVRALAESGVEIHDGDLADDGELLEALQRVSTIEHVLSSMPQLHGATLHDVDAGHDHGRTGMPRASGTTADDERLPLLIAAPRVDGEDDALPPERVGKLAEEVGTLDRGGVDADLVGAGAKQPTRIGDAADAPTHREWDPDSGPDATHRIHLRVAPFGRGGDVEHDDFVCALRLVTRCALCGIADVAEPLEVYALHDSSVPHIEAWNDSSQQAGRAGRRLAL